MASAEEFGISVAEDGSQVINYTVVRGDTLSRISRALRNHHGITVSYQAIAAQNGIDNPNLIRVGQQLTITVPAGQEVELAEPPAQLVETAETAETNEVNQLAPAPAPATEEAGECDEEYDLINAYACDDEVGVCYDDNYGLAELGVALFGDQCIDLDMEDGYVDPATETVAAPLPSGPGVTRPQVVSNVLANPALINQSDTRLALEHQAEHALQAGNIELATEIADLFLANCVDEEGLTAGANIYLNVGNSLIEAGSYSRASSVYRQLATRFSGREQTLSLYPAGQTDETSRGITVRPAQDGENQVYFDGGAYARVLDVRISRLAVARAEQSEFLSRSGVENPFDLGQVRNYILSLPPEAVAEELETYLSAFYFHIGSDVPDDANLSAVMAYPQNIIGQRPVDCRVFAQITRHVLTPGWLTRVANFFGGRQSPYQFHDVYTTQVHYGVQHTDSGHQLLLVESSAGAFMLNNDQVIQLENGSEEQIRTALAGIMESHGYVLTDPNDLPMTHFVVLDDGEQLTGSLFEDASPIVGADVPAVAVDGSDEPAAGNASLIGEG